MNSGTVFPLKFLNLISPEANFSKTLSINYKFNKKIKLIYISYSFFLQLARFQE
jgi:hypothetical protein